MADEERMVDDIQSDDINIKEYDTQTFKFMENILVPSRETTLYVTSLEKITADPRISVKRIILSMFALAVTLIFTFRFNLSSEGKLGYTILPSIFFVISVLALCVMYLAPEIDYSSVLGVNLNSLYNKISERVRVKAGAKVSYPRVNIEDDGFVELGPDQCGYLFKIVGQLNNTTLAAYVEDLAGVRQSYLVEREATTEELFFTKIKTLSYTENLKYFKNRYKNSYDSWSRDYFTKQYNFVDSQIASKEIGFMQYLFITDINRERAEQAVRILTNAAAEGMYEEMTLIDDTNEIKEILGSPLLIELLTEEGNFKDD